MISLPVHQTTNRDDEHFKEVVNASDFFDGENEVDVNDDEADKLEQSLWLEVTGKSASKDDEQFSLIEYLELIKMRPMDMLFFG
jgi:hypothetical protein